MTSSVAGDGAPTRVLIVDDDELVRAGLRTILGGQDGIDVVADVGDGAQAVAAATTHRPDVVVMDIRMPAMNGIDATRAIVRESEAAPRVIVLTTFDLDEYVYEALRAGASGFLLKGAPTGELVAAVRIVANGDALIAPSVTRRLIDRFAAPPGAPAADPPELRDLTARERDVLELIGRGKSNGEIADALVVTPHTVKTHVAHILTKLGVRDRVQAVIYLYESGVIRPGAE